MRDGPLAHVFLIQPATRQAKRVSFL